MSREDHEPVADDCWPASDLGSPFVPKFKKEKLIFGFYEKTVVTKVWLIKAFLADQSFEKENCIWKMKIKRNF